MDPILATGLVNVGQRLIGNMLQGAPEPIQQTAQAKFEDYLTPQAQAVNPLQNTLAHYGIQNAGDLQRVLNHLGAQLAQHPDLAQQLSQMDPEAQVTLTVEDGSYTLNTSDGKSVRIPNDSEAATFARQIHELKQMASLHEQLPGASMPEVANGAYNRPIANATWTIYAPGVML